jgi:hypothetical protein
MAAFFIAAIPHGKAGLLTDCGPLVYLRQVHLFERQYQ